jgi:hypothetical protein
MFVVIALAFATALTMLFLSSGRRACDRVTLYHDGFADISRVARQFTMASLLIVMWLVGLGALVL